MNTSYGAGILTVAVLGSLAVWVWWRSRERPLQRSVAILVLGDVGRSPRMMYHAESFANLGFVTYVIGNKGATPIPSLLSSPCVRFRYLSDSPKPLPGTPFVLYAPRKIALQTWRILEALLVRVDHPPQFILVQNPPSIPTLALVWLVSRITGSKVIIDWHNLGYSILALKLGNNHPFVRIAKWFEAYFGRVAYAHLFVTRAMHDRLVEDWDLHGLKVVLHDRPPAHFHQAAPSEVHQLFQRPLPELSAPIVASFLPKSSPPESTPFTRVVRDQNAYADPINLVLPSDNTYDNDMAPVSRPDRPALVVSSTSWTPDEDFGLLLDALTIYERKARLADGRLPKVLMVVTGKGPDRSKYMKKVASLQQGEGGESAWEYVRCVSMWLEAADYPILLGSADLGISLHSSSSALDLPMKVVDMFGCGLPVCALDFACLNELVRDGVNGLVFQNAEQLATQLETLLTGFPTSPTLDDLRQSLVRSTPVDPSRALPQGLRSPNSPGAQADHPNWPGGTPERDEWEWSSWAQNWDRVVKPLVISNVH
ncbi:glycosyltransferase family 33 protein [Phlebiopsis gigantea 11061_1 CR5-6]|uniref:Chitobiosyldiphosphodolichol beta-mannosyltransferase n=1 Tax=Phlebiopsis gigantea (strain 11061_1 CR5-6) TaxID=745531 RepID=A0A0C3S2X1_PHLG1|nr:glycosyltransferase family 33 protein [Phlebiopsis gigantea 11061_1 CR5-6]